MRPENMAAWVAAAGKYAKYEQIWELQSKEE
jgi:hypothetical protein